MARAESQIRFEQRVYTVPENIRQMIVTALKGYHGIVADDAFGSSALEPDSVGTVLAGQPPDEALVVNTFIHNTSGNKFKQMKKELKEMGFEPAVEPAPPVPSDPSQLERDAGQTEGSD